MISMYIYIMYKYTTIQYEKALERKSQKEKAHIM